MLKRILLLVLVLCFAFTFICQPAAATGVGAAFTVGIIGMVIAGAFGLTFATNAGYEAFGNNIHGAVFSIPGSAGSEWWNQAVAGNIILTDLDESVKTAIWGCAKKAADISIELETGSFTTDFTLSSYSLTSSGNVSSKYNYSGKSYSFSHSFNVPIYCIEFIYPYDTNDSYPYRGATGVCFASSESFYCETDEKYAKEFENFYVYHSFPNYVIDDLRLRQNCTVFSSVDAYLSYIRSLVSMSSGVSSAGGATAAYPTYGYDGVSLPNIDLTQPGLIAEDGTSKVSSLMEQLKSGAITWEDYIGTVAPGQTATITLTDADGSSVTYTLVNTGIGEKVQAGTDVTEATEPIVVPGVGELTGTLADTDARSFLDTLAETIAVPFADVVSKVQAIPAAISDVLSQAMSAFKPNSDVHHYAIDLTKYFPFCIPFDIYDFFMCLNAAPEAPVIEWAIPLPGGEMYPMEIDLSPYDSVALLLRRLQLLLFCVGLAFKTRDLIKG